MDDNNFGIVPHFFYRKTDPETRRIIGLKPTQIEAAIDTGKIPPPSNPIAGGRAAGWQGAELIAYIRQRQARAVAEYRARAAAVRAATTPRAKKKKKRRS